VGFKKTGVFLDWVQLTLTLISRLARGASSKHPLLHKSQYAGAGHCINVAALARSKTHAWFVLLLTLDLLGAVHW